MARKPPSSHIQDPERAKTLHESGGGFYAPYPPRREAVVGYLRLHNQTRPEWDECAELGVLRAPYADTVTGYPIPIGEGTWAAMEDPVKVIRKIADLLWKQGRTDHALVRGIDRAMLADMVGVYLRYEGWAPPRGKEMQAAKTMMDGHEYRLSETADRREMRMMLAVQIDGVVHSTTQYRDAPREIKHMTWNPNDPADAHNRIGGKLPRLLLEFAYGLIKTMRPAYADTPEDM